MALPTERISFRSLLRGFVLCIWLVVALIFAVGGLAKADYDEKVESGELSSGVKGSFAYDGETFGSLEDLRKYKIEKELRSLGFGWLLRVPRIISLVIAAIASGVLGGVARLLKEIVYDKKDILEIPVLAGPTFAGLIALMLLGLSYVIPAALTASKEPVRVLTLLFMCLFGGMFADKVYYWMEKHIFGRIFLDTVKEEK